MEVFCDISGADKIPSYELLDGNDAYESIDLICNSSHFVRIRPKKDSAGKLIGVEPSSNQHETALFLDSHKKTISNFPDVDKEQTHNLISFANIDHPYGTAISVRIIIEDFLKDNFLIPAITKFLDSASMLTLQGYAKTNGTTLSVEAITRITVKGLFEILEGGNPGRKGIKSKLEKAVSEYVLNDPIGSNDTFDKATWTLIQQVFDLTSGVVHGRRYNAMQLFRSAKVVFESISIYFANGGKW